MEQLNAVPAQTDAVERQAAREVFRGLIRKVVTPLPERAAARGHDFYGPPLAEWAAGALLVTKWAVLVSEGGPDRMTSLGAGTGFEPVTFRL